MNIFIRTAKYFSLSVFCLLFALPLVESVNRSVALLVLVIFSLILSAKILRRSFVGGLPSILFLIFVIWTVLILPFSSSLYYSLAEVLRYLAYLLIFIYVSQLEDEAKNKARRLLYFSLIFNSTVLTLFAVIYKFIPRLPLPHGMNLFFASFGHNRISAVLILAIPVLIFNYPINGKKWLNMGFLVLFTGMLLLSGGRGANLSLAASLVAILFFKDPNLLKYSRKSAKAVVAASFVFVIFTYFYSEFLNLSGRPAGYYKPFRFEQRTGYFLQSLSGFRQSPLIGNGPDTFRYISQKYQTQPLSWSWYAHNFILQLLSDTGLIGVLLFVLFLCISLQLFLRSFFSGPGSRQVLTALTVLFVSLMHNLMDYDWQFLSLMLYFLIFLALVVPKGKKFQIRLPLFFILLLLTAGTVGSLVLPTTEKRMQNAEKLIDKGDFDGARKVLSDGLIWDGSNRELYLKSAEIYWMRGYADMAHVLLSRAIELNMLDSESLLKKDYLYYISQAEDAFNQDNPDKAYAYLSISTRLCPVFHFHLNRDFPADYDFRAYLESAKKNVQSISFSPEEVKSCAANIIH
ncbi:MAG: hypothetical protein UV73_C0002G0118 [Candidatus Gottesmanbacteria bacterium GW2011_GWA2_43_14]|uniref:O-antigen ligase-related domain-containing protein n=1 Tax=Candidatus Gottesmanbacteria bacterium GW2011_GWA2_43_14 TaxID=1618443 RepID=A0A0G1DL72_9BACT|nr:MAG: hypothetical protein UV73_C0002G0118 [Candidatus Gottesmanbacteria bacterium GW2011_GWA2_43_14]